VRQPAGKTKWLWLAALAGLSVVGRPLPAQAHLVTTGVGPFFDGIAHAFLSIEDMLAMAALAALAGMSGKASARTAVIVYPSAWVAGSVIGQRVGIPPIQPWLAIVTLLGIGLAIAAKLRLPPGLTGLLACAVAFATGLVAAFDLAGVWPIVPFMLGSVTAMLVAMLLIAAASNAFTTGWRLVALRALGSWLAAAGLLLLGWTLRGLA
jgi:hypothetical protein